MIKHNFSLVVIFTIILTSLSAQNAINAFDENGERHGIWRKNYPNTDQIRYEGKFNHGREVDTFKYYKLKRKKSVLSALKIFNRVDNTSEVTFMASNGSTVSEGKMSGKNFIGKWVFYHKNSPSVMIEEYYNNDGLLDGVRKVFFVNGKKAEEVAYKDGKQNGFSKIYSESGQLLQNSSYTNDKLNGSTIYYDVNGSVNAKGKFKDNVKIGIWEYYKDAELVRKVDHDTNKVLFRKQ